MELYLALAFLVISFIYASVGFGGGSSYLALLAMVAWPFPEIRMIALICNIAVVSGNTLVFVRYSWWEWRRFWPFIVTSVPAAFLGASAPIRAASFFLLLGISLVVAAILLWRQQDDSDSAALSGAPKPFRDAGIGGAIGLLSGLVGIGGGIFLSPVLHYIRWAGVKQIAALASIFILVNSLAGLVGQWWRFGWPANGDQLLILVLAVVAGGQLGVHTSIRWLNADLIRKITAALVFWAGIQVLIAD